MNALLFQALICLMCVLALGAMYSEAVDPTEFDRVYTETDITVEPENIERHE